MLKSLKNYYKGTKAATAIEFAIIAPVFFFLFLGIVEFGLTVFFDSSLNTGIRSAARAGVPQGFSSKAQVEQILNNNLGGLYNSSNGQVIVLTFDNFNSPAFTAARTQFTTDPASFFNTAAPFPPQATQGGKIVLYGVKYNWGGFTGLAALFGTGNPRSFIPNALYSFSIVRNEEF